jgi:hypothetical protein
VEVPDATAAHGSVENQLPADASALAGFLFQQGCQDKSVVRHYLDALFRKPEVASR